MTLSDGSSSDKFKMAETKQLPATFSTQYHFSTDRDFQPYAGLGVNWTSFSSTRFVSISDTELVFEDPELGIGSSGTVKIDPFFYALNLGFFF